MRLHNKKIRSAISDAAELEVLLLKQAIYSALVGDCTVEYRDRYVLGRHSGEEGQMFIVNKLPDFASFVAFKSTQLHDAVDHFLNTFVAEDNSNIDAVVFKDRNDIGVRWHTIRRVCTCEDLIDPTHFAYRFAVLVREWKSDNEEINRSSSKSHQNPGC